MDRRMLAIVMALAAAALFVLVAVYTWATAAALGAVPGNTGFVLATLPLVAAPLVGAVLLLRERLHQASAVLGTAAVVWLPVPASSVRLLAGGRAGVWTASALLEVAAYGAVVLAAVLALQLGPDRPPRTRISAAGAVLALAVVAGSVWPPVTTPRSGPGDWLRPLVATAAGPGDAAVLALMVLVTAVVLYAGLSTAEATGAIILATAAAVLVVDHVSNLLLASGAPDTTLAPAGWAGLLGTLGLLFFAVTRLRGRDDQPYAPAALAPDPDAA